MLTEFAWLPTCVYTTHERESTNVVWLKRYEFRLKVRDVSKGLSMSNWTCGWG